MHAGISFALGRWVAPLLPVGLDSSGSVAWEEWKPRFCDPGNAPGIGWWYERDHAALSGFLKLLIAAFMDPDRRERLWMQISIPAEIDSSRQPRASRAVTFSGGSGALCRWAGPTVAGLTRGAEWRVHVA